MARNPRLDRDLRGAGSLYEQLYASTKRRLDALEDSYRTFQATVLGINNEDGTVPTTPAVFGLQDAYTRISDGTNVAAAIGSDTLRLRSANSSLTITVGDNSQLYGDNVLFTVSSAGVTDHGALTGLTDDDHTQYFLLAGETTDAKLYSGADIKLYSDTGSTLKASIDGATGNTTLQGTLDVTGQITTTGGFVIGTEAGGYVYANHCMQVVATGTKTPLMMAAGSGAIEIWQDTTPTKAVSIGCAVPGNAISDDLYIGGFNGATWVELWRTTNHADATGAHMYIPIYSAGRFGIQIKAAAAQTANLQEWQDSAGNVLASISATGTAYINANSATALMVEQDGVKDNTFIVDTTNGSVGVGGAPSTNRVRITGATDVVQLAIRRVDGQSNALQEWETSGGTALAKVMQNGAIGVGSTPSGDTKLDILGATSSGTGGPLAKYTYSTTQSTAQSYNATVFSLYVSNSGSGNITDGITGFNAQVVQNGAGTISNMKGANLQVQNLHATGTVTTATGLYVDTPTMASNGTIGYYRGIWIRNPGHAKVDEAYGLVIANVSGSPYANYAIYTGTGLVQLGDQLSIVGSADRVQSIVKGASGQTANLTQWQDSSGNVLALVNISGGFVFNEYSLDVDCRIEGNGEANLFYTDGGNDRIGIATNAPNSRLQVVGSQAVTYRGITADRTLDATDYMVDVTANTITVTLPTAVGIEGRVYVIKNSGTGVVTIDGDGSETIDSLTTYVISTQYNSVTIVSDNANWKVV